MVFPCLKLRPVITGMSLISVSLYALVSTSDSSEVIVDTLIINGFSVSKTPTGINFVTGISPPVFHHILH